METSNIRKIRDLLYQFYHLQVELTCEEIDTVINKFSYNVRELLYSELNLNGVSSESYIYDKILKDINLSNENYTNYTTKIISELELLVSKHTKKGI